jgi:hypothetical protein
LVIAHADRRPCRLTKKTLNDRFMSRRHGEN